MNYRRGGVCLIHHLLRWYELLFKLILMAYFIYLCFNFLPCLSLTDL